MLGSKRLKPLSSVRFWAELLLWDPATKRHAGHTALPFQPPCSRLLPLPHPQPAQLPHPPPAPQPIPQNNQQPHPLGQHQNQQQQQQQQGASETLRLIADLQTLVGKAFEDNAAQEKRLNAIKPLLKTGNSGEDSLVSIDVSGTSVTVTTGVAKSLGDDSTFANRFLKYDPLIVGVPVDYVQRVVDMVARSRMRGEAITSWDVHEAKGDADPKGYRRVLDMYGFAADRYLGPLDGLLTTLHLQMMRRWCTLPLVLSPPPIPPCVGEPVMRIYKASVDGWKWLDLLEAVKGFSPLLLIFRVAASDELLAIIIEGPIEITGTAKREADIKSHAFKLQGTNSHPFAGYLGFSSRLFLAGTQELATAFDFSSSPPKPPSKLTSLLCPACLDFGVRPDGQPGAPAATDQTLRRCHGASLVTPLASGLRGRLRDHGVDSDSVMYGVSESGWQFDLAELEVYRLRAAGG